MNKKELKKLFNELNKKILNSYKDNITSKEWAEAQIALLNRLSYKLKLKSPLYCSLVKDYI